MRKKVIEMAVVAVMTLLLGAAIVAIGSDVDGGLGAFIAAKVYGLAMLGALVKFNQWAERRGLTSMLDRLTKTPTR